MKRVCITINLKRKIQKITNKKFEYYIEEHLNNDNFEKITNKLFEDNIKFLYIEQICLQNLTNIEEVLDFFKNNKVKVVIVYIKKELIDNCGADYIDITRDNFDAKVEYVEVQTKERKKYKKQEEQNFKFLENTILSLALDRKLYMTTYLLNLASMYKNKKVLLVEIKQSIIDYKTIIQDEKVEIDYKVLRNINEIQKLKCEQYDKVIIDLGYVYNIKYVQKILNNLNIPILVFETNCIKVVENKKYIQIIRLLEKYNNVFFINRGEIFDKIIQESINPFKSKVIRKHIRKNKLGEI